MQAIATKYIPPTNCRGSRIKASCDRGSISIPYPHELSGDEVHREAVRQLVAKFVSEDAKTYGPESNDMTAATWAQETGDRFTLIQVNGEWFLSWNGPLYTPLDVCESDRLLGHFRAARGEFDADKRPEVGLLYRKFEEIITAIMEGVQTR